MSYPSVISQPGSAARNLDPVLGALAPLVENGASSILELASYPFEHIVGYAERWPAVQFTGTVRDDHELGALGDKALSLPPNVHEPLVLDVAVDADWERAVPLAPYDGVVMLNLIHCMPEDLPERIFEQLSPRTDAGRKLLKPHGWIVAYGAYLNDDGTFKSPGDEKFDREHVKSVHPSLGLRSAASISDMARRWGFAEVQRAAMPKGNLFIVWRGGECG